MGFGGPTCLHGSVNVNVGGRWGGQCEFVNLGARGNECESVSP